MSEFSIARRSKRIMAPVFCGALLLAGCSKDSKAPVQGNVTPREAQSALNQGKSVRATVVEALIEPKGGVKGEETAYMPMEIEGKYYIATCNSGKIALSELAIPEGSRMQDVSPANTEGLVPFNADALLTEEVDVSSVNCELLSDGPALFGKTNHSVAYIGTSVG